MKPVTMYLDECIDRGLARNDSDIGRKIGATRAAISDWRVGRSHPNDDMAVRLADLLGKDPGELLAECGAARAKTPETRRAWERVAARMAATGITVCILIALGAPDETYAGVIMGPDVTVFRSALFVLLQWLMFRHPAYDGVHKKCALCIQLISSRLFVGMSALLGHRPVLV